jgi:hypothetical protein
MRPSLSHNLVCLHLSGDRVLKVIRLNDFGTLYFGLLFARYRQQRTHAIVYLQQPDFQAQFAHYRDAFRTPVSRPATSTDTLVPIDTFVQ